MSDFDIYLDTDNELTFTVGIEGANEATVRSQFIIESSRGVNLCFEGKAAGSEISVDVPTLKGMLREGIYSTRLEVIVDDRIFTPLQMQAMIKPAIKVEAVVRTAQRVSGPVVTASVVSRPKPIVETPTVLSAAVSSPVRATVAAPLPAAVLSPVPVAPPPAKIIRTKGASPRPIAGLDRLLDTLEKT